MEVAVSDIYPSEYAKTNLLYSEEEDGDGDDYPFPLHLKTKSPGSGANSTDPMGSDGASERKPLNAEALSIKLNGASLASK